ncbi:MAG: YtxH domain-containing protein [Bacteroidota bacterium]
MGYRNNRALLLLGAAAGAAVGYFWNTEKGKQFRKDANVAAQKYSTQIQQQSQQTLSQTNSSVNELLEKGKAQLNVLQQKAKEAVDDISTNLQSTADEAKSAINRKSEQVEDHFAHTNNNHTTV